MEKLCSLCRCKILSPVGQNVCDENHTILSIFFNCFDRDFQTDLKFGNSAVFICLRCKSFLTDWQDVEIQISQLKCKSRHYQASLVSRILCGRKNPIESESEFKSCGSSKVTHPSILQDIHKVIQNLLNEFSCQVSLQNMESNSFEGSPFKSENNNIAADDDIISECGSLDNTNFLQVYSDDESETDQSSLKIPCRSSASSIPKLIPEDAELISMYGCNIRVAHNEFWCTECSEVRTNRKSMERHVRHVHRKIMPCDIPVSEQKPSRYTNATDLGNGRFARGPFVIETVNNDHFKCLTCSKIGYNLGRLLHHIGRIHFKEHPDLIPPPVPRKKFTRAKEVSPGVFDYFGHLIRFDSTQAKFICSSCGVKKSRRREIQTHIRAEHLNSGQDPLKTSTKKRPKNPIPAEKKFMCEECGKTFDRPSALQRHTSVHNQGTPFQCSECGKRFKWELSLKKHALSHEGQDKKFVCSFCGKGYVCSWDLKKHEKKHTGEKFACKTCGQEFSTFYLLKVHRRDFHKNGPPEFQAENNYVFS